jgi:hypothetical protein
MSSLLKVCGIDPGTSQSAFVVWDGATILDRQIIENVESLAYLNAVDCGLIACEHIQSYGMAVGKEVFETCYWVGRYWQICGVRGIEWCRTFRSEVKAHWCHSPKANDSNIRAAVIDRLGSPGVKKAPGVTYGVSKDLWSALAIAVRAYDIKTGIQAL